MSDTTLQADPITTEIIRNAFVSCAQDMNATLIRSSYTPIIYEGKDCSVAILDEHGGVLGQSLGLPLFLGNLEICVKLTAELLGWDAFQAGRRLLHERLVHGRDAPERRDGVRADLLARPARRLLGDACPLARRRRKDPAGRWTRPRSSRRACAGARRASTTGGEPREDIIDLLRRNGRFGYSLVGDMNAQVAACRTGEARFQAILDRFGYETYASARHEIFGQSEELEREAVAALPDGTYTAEGSLDDDGLDHGPIPVHVRIDVEGDRMTIDLERLGAACTRGRSTAASRRRSPACRVAFKLLINPERPVDGGTFKTLEVKCRRRLDLHGRGAGGMPVVLQPLGLLIDLVVKALAPVLPERGGGGALRRLDGALHLGGRDPRRGDSRS